MNSYRELQIFIISKELAIRVHFMTLALPRFEVYEEGNQIRRSSKAVTTSIVEGYGRRRYKADFIKFLIYSISECDETLLHLEFLFETKSLKDVDIYNDLKVKYIQLSKQINKYIQWVEIAIIPAQKNNKNISCDHWLPSYLATQQPANQHLI